jgi:hypothetical protein
MARQPKQPFEVLVGNIGTIYSGNNYMTACCKFQAYVTLSRTNSGRAAGESVTILQGGEIRKEYFGTLEDQDNG